MNTFGRFYRLTSFGESHGPAIGGVIDGVPAGIPIDLQGFRTALERRRPDSPLTSQRREPDEVEFLSGIYNGVTLGSPIGFIIRNKDARSEDYAASAQLFRPNHGDYTYQKKYGIRDPRGGGRSSARETATRIVAGELARQALSMLGVRISAFTSAISTVEIKAPLTLPSDTEIYASAVRCPDRSASARMEAELSAARANKDSLGGVVSLMVEGVPAGWGEPVAGKLSADLSAALMSIPAAKGVEIGDGFAAARCSGSNQIDYFHVSQDGTVYIEPNHSGGIQGGISNGARIYARVAFKPIASLPGREIETIDSDGNKAILRLTGRHDICAVPRAVPVVEAVAAAVLLDAALAARLSRWV